MKIMYIKCITWVWVVSMGFFFSNFGISCQQKKEWFDKISQNDGNINFYKNPQTVEDIQENFAFWDYISNYPHKQSSKSISFFQYMASYTTKITKGCIKLLEERPRRPSYYKDQIASKYPESNCGPACAAMIINWATRGNIDLSVDEVRNVEGFDYRGGGYINYKLIDKTTIDVLIKNNFLSVNYIILNKIQKNNSFKNIKFLFKNDEEANNIFNMMKDGHKLVYYGVTSFNDHKSAIEMFIPKSYGVKTFIKNIANENMLADIAGSTDRLVMVSLDMRYIQPAITGEEAANKIGRSYPFDYPQPSRHFVIIKYVLEYKSKKYFLVNDPYSKNNENKYEANIGADRLYPLDEVYNGSNNYVFVIERQPQ